MWPGVRALRRSHGRGQAAQGHERAWWVRHGGLSDAGADASTLWVLWQSRRPWQLRQLSILGLLVACGTAGVGSSGEHYLIALDAAVPLDVALAGCQRLSSQDARGDCATAAVEVRGAITDDACEPVPAGIWHDECRFMLAERQRAAGQLAVGLVTCGGQRFGRECTFHLIRSEAWAVRDQPATEAATRLGALADLPFARDAERLFWREWHHRGLVEGRPVDPGRCEGLPDTDACRGVVGELFRDAAAARGWSEVCARVAAGRPPLSRRGEPSYVSSPEVDGWLDRECPER